MQPPYPRDQQGHTMVAHHANALGIAVEGLEFKAGEIDALQLFCGVQRMSV